MVDFTQQFIRAYSPRNAVQFIRDFIVPFRLGVLYFPFRQRESVYSRKFIDMDQAVERMRKGRRERIISPLELRLAVRCRSRFHRVTLVSSLLMRLMWVELHGRISYECTKRKSADDRK